MCGQALSQQEERILLKKSHMRGSKLKFREFTLAVEEITNDVKADPYQLVYNLLKLFFKGEDKVTFEGLRSFFQEFATYF